MARPYWSGNIQISLVSFGVHLFTATETASDIHFHLIDRRTGERVKHQNVASSTMDRDPEASTEPVDKSNIVKGYEYTRGRYVTIEPDELAHLRVPSKRTMEVTQFVDLATIEPEYFERPFFVVPADASQTEAFLTIRQALLDTKKVALTRIAFAGREHVVAIAPASAAKSKSPKSRSSTHMGLMAYTLRFAAELRDPATYFESINPLPINDDSLNLAKELIQRKSAPFEPSKFTDGYEAAVKELVAAKLKHAPIPREETPKHNRKNVIHLIDALRKSVSSSTKNTDTAKTSRSALKKVPKLIKTNSKPARTSPARKSA